MALLLEGGEGGEGGEAMAALEAGKARLLAAWKAPEAGLIGLVQPRHHVLQEVRVEGSGVRELRADGLHLGCLLLAEGSDAGTLPCRDAWRERRVVACAAAPHHRIQRPRLLRRWP